jgi:hypothetical protein
MNVEIRLQTFRQTRCSASCSTAVVTGAVPRTRPASAGNVGARGPRQLSSPAFMKVQKCQPPASDRVLYCFVSQSFPLLPACSQ